jgi:Bax protein
MIARLTTPLASLAARFRVGPATALRAAVARPLAKRFAFGRRQAVALYSSALVGLMAFGFGAGGQSSPALGVQHPALSWVVPIAIEAGDAAHAAGHWLDGLRTSNLWPEQESATPPLQERTVDGLEERFSAIGFQLADVRAGNAQVPRVFLASLPGDMHEVTETDKRKRMFIATLLPLVLKSNEKILADRERLLNLADRRSLGLALKPADEEWLAELAETYAVEPGDLAELKRRVDIVPPSLALAQSAEESGWGTSRYALRGNALFGQYTTSERGNLVPAARGDGQTHAIRAFDALGASVEGYMRNLNSHQAYGDFRRKREQQRANGHEPEARALLSTLHRYSARGQDYIRTINTIMRVNQLDNFDRAKLAYQQYSMSQ